MVLQINPIAEGARNVAEDGLDGSPPSAQPRRSHASAHRSPQPPFGAGDRRCYQGESFDPAQPAPPDSVLNDYGFLQFALLLPAEYAGGSFPILVALRGGGVAWNDSSVSNSNISANAWSFEFDNPNNPVWRKGRYQGMVKLAQADFNEQLILEYLLDEEGLVTAMRDKGWGVLIPSGCSHDHWNGRATLVDDDPAFAEAANTRYGHELVKEALEIVDEVYDIAYFYIAGTSGGGDGAFLLANDLPDSLPVDFTNRFRGAIADAAPSEFNAMDQLYKSADANGELPVDNDLACPNTEVTVPCDNINEPLDQAFDRVGLTGRSLSQDIETKTIVPVLHLWNKRDQAHCYNYCYSETNLHGPIRDAIINRKADGTNERFDFSENLEFCAGSCKSVEGTIVECTKHGSLGPRDAAPVNAVLQCAVDWIDAVDAAYVNDQPTLPYVTPPSCLATIHDVPMGNEHPCNNQGAELGW